MTWETCHVGSCHRHQKCMYGPCRNAIAERGDAPQIQAIAMKGPGGSLIELPWPPKELSGHHDVHWRVLQPIKKKHRTWAALATIAADIPTPEGNGDIRVSVTFYPPDRRGDRTNYPNRMKPYFDGIADALKVNDRRFLPAYHFAEPVSNPRVVVAIG